MSDLFSSRLVPTHENDATIISMLDLSFIYSLHKLNKMELLSASQGEVLDLGNPTKERDTWKGKVEVMELRCYTFQKELPALQKVVKVANSLQKEEKIHYSPSALASPMTNL